MHESQTVQSEGREGHVSREEKSRAGQLEESAIIHSEEAQRKFWAKVDKSGPCWIWTGAQQGPGYETRNGYGTLWFGGKLRKTHRISWMIASGEAIPSGMCILHKCDNPPCCNPDHLFMGTLADNMRDMARKGRNCRLFGMRSSNRRDQNGEDNGRAKLTNNQVREARTRFQKGGIQVLQLAKEYGVSDVAMGKIVQGQTYIFE